MVNIGGEVHGGSGSCQLWFPSKHDPSENDHGQVSFIVILKHYIVDSWLPRIAGFFSRYLHEDEIGIPGSLRNMKQTFHHKHAGREAKVIN